MALVDHHRVEETLGAFSILAEVQHGNLEKRFC